MPYPKKLLNDYEELAVDLHPHWLYFVEVVFALVVSIILGIVLVSIDAPNAVRWIALFLILGCAVWVVIRYLKWMTTNFVITSDRVIFRHGVFAKTGIEIPLERVNSVHFNQTILERIVGAGDLLIESGSEGGQQRFTDVHNPDRIQNLIHSQMELNDQRMHRHQPGEAGASGASGSPGAVSAPPHDVTVQLERLEALRDRGTLTDEEFHEQKQRLLGK
jgi:membrane protein YdbS with pleckstrin-like domain